jgi:uncharacterized protein
MKTLVLGATTKPDKYAHTATTRLLEKGHEVVLLGRQVGKVADLTIGTEPIDIADIHTVTLYLNPANQEMWYDYLLRLKPQRIIFNPGTENPTLALLAQKHNIETLEACTLVMLATGQY